MDKIRNFKQTFWTCKFCYQYTSDVFITFFFLQQISPKKIRTVMMIKPVQMMKGPMKCCKESGFKSDSSMTGGGATGHAVHCSWAKEAAHKENTENKASASHVAKR